MKRYVALKISGMTCKSCSDRIRKETGKLRLEELRVSFEDGSLTCITDNAEALISTIDAMGYKAELKEAGKESKSHQRVLLGVTILLAFYLIIKNTIGFNSIPTLEEGAGYGLLLVLGLLTSLHCISMCGGIVLSQSLTFNNPIKTSILYNAGRVIAYTIVGGIVGGLGAVMSPTPQLKGYISIFAGGFMLLLGLSMLETFSFLRKYVKLPRLLDLSKYKEKGNTPFVIGLATGFMPCGPLQTMQLYALGTGSALKGALAMLVFSIGTVPLMLGLGTLSGYMGNGLNRQLKRVSGIIVVLLGLIVINRGLILQGRPAFGGLADKGIGVSEAVLPEMINGFQSITTYANDKGYEPNYFIVEKGKTVKWVVRGDAVNTCNNEIIIPKLEISQKIEPGFNLIEFTPQEAGELSFSCWMGMLDGKFVIVDDINNIPDNIKAIPTTRADCCSGS